MPPKYGVLRQVVYQKRFIPHEKLRQIKVVSQSLCSLYLLIGQVSQDSFHCIIFYLKEQQIHFGLYKITIYPITYMLLVVYMNMK
jgi:hypothetical protein